MRREQNEMTENHILDTKTLSFNVTEITQKEIIESLWFIWMLLFQKWKLTDNEQFRNIFFFQKNVQISFVDKTCYRYVSRHDVNIDKLNINTEMIKR